VIEMRKKGIYALSLVLILTGLLTYLSFTYLTVSSCGAEIGYATLTKSNLPSMHFNGITKFHLKDDRFPNGLVVSSDGSVWFGEQDVPGLGHLYPNGTIFEYTWPITYAPSTTSIWGVAEWNNGIWASDALGNQIVGLDPATSRVYAVRINQPGAFPYTLSVGPDGLLWFTELYGAKLGRIDTQCSLKEYSLPSTFGGTPTQIEFTNSTFGYYIDGGNVSSGRGSLLWFNTTQFSPERVQGKFTLTAPSSLVLVSGGVWVAQHATSNLAYYDLSSHEWSQFPTSPVDYEETTLPYFVAANGSTVWFNEHYANRLGRIDTARGLLTEYSLSDPPASNITRIDNALTFALGKDKVWFTELTANYVGYLDAAYQPNFTISAPNISNVKLKPGESVNVTLTVNGESSKPLTIQFADTENYTSRPQMILMTTNTTEIQPSNSQQTIQVTITAEKTLPPGNYTLLVTVTDQLINQGAYINLQTTT